MPLLDFGGEKAVTIDNDVYTLRRTVSWVQRAKCSASKGTIFYVKRKDLDNGLADIGPDELIPMSMDADEETQLLRLETWIAKWSYSEPITRRNLERLPRAHVQALLQEIRQLEKEQDGPAPDSPLSSD